MVSETSLRKGLEKNVQEIYAPGSAIEKQKEEPPSHLDCIITPENRKCYMKGLALMLAGFSVLFGIFYFQAKSQLETASKMPSHILTVQRDDYIGHICNYCVKTGIPEYILRIEIAKRNPGKIEKDGTVKRCTEIKLPCNIPEHISECIYEQSLPPEEK